MCVLDEKSDSRLFDHSEEVTALESAPGHSGDVTSDLPPPQEAREEDLILLSLLLFRLPLTFRHLTYSERWACCQLALPTTWPRPGRREIQLHH